MMSQEIPEPMTTFGIPPIPLAYEVGGERSQLRCATPFEPFPEENRRRAQQVKEEGKGLVADMYHESQWTNSRDARKPSRGSERLA